MKSFKVSVVLPSYNEEGNLPVIAEQLVAVLQQYADYEIIFVNDCSSDRTLEIAKKLHQENSRINYLSFSRNFGHQYALKAGLDYATGDCVISMDADLQHPVELIPDLVAKWQEGNDIVYTVRKESKNQSFFKRKTSNLFYKLMSFMTGIHVPKGAADFRLLDRKVVDVIRHSKEKILFLRGYVTWIGFRQAYIEYIPAKRFSGKSSYTLRKMISFAITGITSFGVMPLRIAVFLGLIVVTLGMIYAAYVLYMKFCVETFVITGWASMMIVLLILGGVQLIILGVMGEYIGLIFIETKKRPNYIVAESSLIKCGKFLLEEKSKTIAGE